MHFQSPVCCNKLLLLFELLLILAFDDFALPQFLQLDLDEKFKKLHWLQFQSPLLDDIDDTDDDEFCLCTPLAALQFLHWWRDLKFKNPHCEQFQSPALPPLLPPEFLLLL